MFAILFGVQPVHVIVHSNKLIPSKYLSNDKEDEIYLIHILYIDLQEVDVWSEITIIISDPKNVAKVVYHKWKF